MGTPTHIIRQYNPSFCIDQYFGKFLPKYCYYGSQTKLEQEKHQDEPSLGGTLEVLKPHFKGYLYNEFRFFFNTGADSNVRNRLAHGLCDINEIDDFAHYLWWLAIKMYWCDNEIFQEKGA